MIFRGNNRYKTLLPYHVGVEFFNCKQQQKARKKNVKMNEILSLFPIFLIVWIFHEYGVVVAWKSNQNIAIVHYFRGHDESAPQAMISRGPCSSVYG